MGLFGGGDTNDRQEQLAKNAKGESVTSERLTSIKRGFGKGRDYLSDSSIFDWLEEAEQPHFIFPSQGGSHHINTRVGSDLVPNGEYRIIAAITTERILILIGDESGDQSLSIEYDAVSGVGYNKKEPSENSSILSSSVATLMIEVEEEAYFIQSSFFEQDMQEASEYIFTRSDLSGKIKSNFETPKTASQEAMDRVDERLEQATSKPNDSGPQPIYSGKGGKVRIEGNTKQRENCGGVEVYENKLKVQKKGMINRSWITIPINEIQSVDTTVFGKVSIVTEANDYKISGCSIAPQLVKFVNEWEDEPNTATQGDGFSAAEEIEKFAELNEKGIISDKEFEDKKEELL